MKLQFTIVLVMLVCLLAIGAVANHYMDGQLERKKQQQIEQKELRHQSGALRT